MRVTNYIHYLLIFVLILFCQEDSYAISSKTKREIQLYAINGKPGVNHNKYLNSSLKNKSSDIFQEIAEKAQISKPLTETQVQETKHDPLESVDISPAAKTLLSLLPSGEDAPVVVSQDDPSEITSVITVRKNDSFIAIFNRLGYSRDEINKFIFLLEKEAGFDVRNLKLGQRFIIKKKVEGNKAEFVSMQIPNNLMVIKIVKEGDEYKLFKDEKEVKSKYIYKEGKIKSSITNLASRIGIPSKVVAKAGKILSNRYDLRTQIRKDDKFKILYQQIYDTKGKLIDSGRILYVAVEGKVIKDEAYRFSESNNDKDANYYDAKGITFVKSITRKPIKDKYRISSHFGYRIHPILKKRLLHAGVDYAAPRGTKIYAAGDGTITKIGRFGGYGNYIKIKHDSKWQTAYGHLRSFAKGMRKWKRVKKGDLIGYVGSTGRSTGPHLHYEILRNGKAVDPLKVKLPTGKKLSGTKLSKFKEEASKIRDILEAVS